MNLRDSQHSALLTRAAYPPSACCGAELCGGPVILWCARCGRQVHASCLDTDVRKSAWAGTAAADHTCSAQWPASARSVGAARVMVRRVMTRWGLAALAEDVELMASELVANAVVHGRGPITTVLRLGTGHDGGLELTCEVSDAGPGLPRQRQPGQLDESGRGLAIVTALAAATGARRTAAGTTAWFRIPVPEVTSP